MRHHLSLSHPSFPKILPGNSPIFKQKDPPSLHHPSSTALLSFFLSFFLDYRTKFFPLKKKKNFSPITFFKKTLEESASPSIQCLQVRVSLDGISKESVRNSRNETQRNATQRGKVGGIVGRGKLKRVPRLRFEARGEVEKLSSAIIHREREERERERERRLLERSGPRLGCLPNQV